MRSVQKIMKSTLVAFRAALPQADNVLTLKHTLTATMNWIYNIIQLDLIYIEPFIQEAAAGGASHSKSEAKSRQQT